MSDVNIYKIRVIFGYHSSTPSRTYLYDNYDLFHRDALKFIFQKESGHYSSFISNKKHWIAMKMWLNKFMPEHKAYKVEEDNIPIKEIYLMKLVDGSWENLNYEVMPPEVVFS